MANTHPFDVKTTDFHTSSLNEFWETVPRHNAHVPSHWGFTTERLHLCTFSIIFKSVNVLFKYKKKVRYRRLGCKLILTGVGVF